MCTFSQRVSDPKKRVNRAVDNIKLWVTLLTELNERTEITNVVLKQYRENIIIEKYTSVSCTFHNPKTGVIGNAI